MRCCIKYPAFDSLKFESGYRNEIKFAYVESFFPSHFFLVFFSGKCRMQVLVLSFQRNRIIFLKSKRKKKSQ